MVWSKRQQAVAAPASVPVTGNNGRRRLLAAGSALTLAALLLVGVLGAPPLPGQQDEASLLLVLLIGLTAGGLSCLAVQGGLLATAVAQREERLEAGTLEARPALERNASPILWFLGAKLIAYALLGALLGALGALAQPSPDARAIVQGLTAFLMIATAFHFLGVHPVFRHAILQPPRFLTTRIRRTAGGHEAFAPALLGALTVFLPCGVTQAIALLAINTGSAASGTLVMSAFVLGTSPLFFSLGYLATKVGEIARARFLKVAAVAILAVALISLDGALRLGGAPVTFAKAQAALFPPSAPAAGTSPAAQDGVQELRITAGAGGYSPARAQIRSGAPARVVFTGDGSGGCALALLFQDQQYILDSSRPTMIELPAQSPGTIEYSCSMGMFGGTIAVI